MKEADPEAEYFHALADKIQRDLNNEVYRDAFAEVQVIRRNVLAAFTESAAHPHDVHGVPPLIPTVRRQPHLAQALRLA